MTRILNSAEEKQIFLSAMVSYAAKLLIKEFGWTPQQVAQAILKEVNSDDSSQTELDH